MILHKQKARHPARFFVWNCGLGKILKNHGIILFSLVDPGRFFRYNDGETLREISRLNFV